MDPRDLTAYLAVLESHLPVGRRARARILAEVADGLACAMASQAEHGMAPEEAARAAVAEFGDPRMLAAVFARQLGMAAAHRIGLGLVMTGPLVGLTWVAAYATRGPDLPARVAGMLSALPLLVLILAVTVPAAVVATAGAGWAGRYLRLPPAVVTGAALVAVIGCVAADVSLLGTAVLGGRLTPVAVAASVVRLSAAAWAGGRMARLRAAPHAAGN